MRWEARLVGQGGLDEALQPPLLTGELSCESDECSRVARLVAKQVRDGAPDRFSVKGTTLRVRVDIFADGKSIETAHSKSPFMIIEVL